MEASKSTFTPRCGHLSSAVNLLSVWNCHSVLFPLIDSAAGSHASLKAPPLHQQCCGCYFWEDEREFVKRGDPLLDTLRIYLG